MTATQRVDSWLTQQEPAPLGLKYLVDRYLGLSVVDDGSTDLQMNLIYDCLVRFIGGRV